MYYYTMSRAVLAVALRCRSYNAQFAHLSSGQRITFRPTNYL